MRMLGPRLVRTAHRTGRVSTLVGILSHLSRQYLAHLLLIATTDDYLYWRLRLILELRRNVPTTTFCKKVFR